MPVLAVPYFNFPIDDRRTTGLLSPTFGYSNESGVQLTAPVYLNLAPNYDLTLTPSYMSKRGAKLDAEFRYMTESFGSGRIWVMLLLEEGHLKRQYREQLVDIAFDVLDAPLLPRPYLGRDVIVDGYLRMRMDILGYVEIESQDSRRV